MPTLSFNNQQTGFDRPLIMGIVNVTPDSFSDGGRYHAFDQALAHARQLMEEGADILDIGGESTRPGASEVSTETELERVLPLIKQLSGLHIPISVDTSKPEVMSAAVEAGASIINDVYALRRPGALRAAVDSGASICLMHMLGEPRTMQVNPHYNNVTAEVTGFLKTRADALKAAGCDPSRILLDPGFGFGKTLNHNLTLLRNLHQISTLGYPILVGLSRKSMLGAITGHKNPQDRIYASLAAALISVQNGARIVRVHDVAATRDVLNVLDALNKDQMNEA
ncbi:MAG: dihydropteroate synthase [Proteobacteria bacterium]|nr:dihydropteroate synthase [Pseudomonadota bacterium]MDE3208498.1 dihydropteroate synthase [Pseudomonadota bacterium]